MVTVLDEPGFTYCVDADGESVKPAPCTVRPIAADALREPDTPVTTTFEMEYGAELPAVRVRVLVPAVLAGLNEAVTSLGRPDADRATLPLNPPRSMTVNVVVVDAPGLSVSPACAATIERVKPGAARALIRFAPLGLPHPVTRS